jgi:hypothetical protein
MARVQLALAAIPTCVAAGVAGALAGMCVELGSPLSEPNFSGAVVYGYALGGVGAFAVAVTVISRSQTRDSLRVLIWGTVLTGLVSLAFMWWDVVSSLG